MKLPPGLFLHYFVHFKYEIAYTPIANEMSERNHAVRHCHCINFCTINLRVALAKFHFGIANSMPKAIQIFIAMEIRKSMSELIVMENWFLVTLYFVLLLLVDCVIN